jgi:hypothetical protein
MKLHGIIHELPNHIKLFIGAFIIVLSIGYISGLQFVRQTEASTANGIQENFLGNEDLDVVEVMKFEKGKREMLSILHTHILSISFIFFLLGGILSLTSLPKKLKSFLMIEPFISIVLTFGGIYLLWKGILWMKYVVFISGAVMTAVFIIGAAAILIQLCKKPELST